MLTAAEKMDVVRRHQTHWPVQTIAIAEALGVLVYHVTGWPDDLSGQIKKAANKEEDGGSGYVIFVNATHHKNRRRFTTAHEIAHYILHNNLIGDGIADDGLYRSRLGGPVETQANKLAADILMPWPLINRAIAQGHDTVDGLAKLFEVSPSSMAIRIGVPSEA